MPYRVKADYADQVMVKTRHADLLVAAQPAQEVVQSDRAASSPAMRPPGSFSLPLAPQSTFSRNVNARFGFRLRTLRRQKRWTQLQMAIIFGINRSYISEIERGQKSVSLGMLEVIALGFHMSIAELLRDI
ncbi:MAG TPA: helix-turn-helix transcriptional regulator [Pseudacidobacterium sp.]|jgi:DNA-binding XRE family transcriptional regulator|nr:helix-turn-helix transcriptional regulator [Pseudacidobacterium sp.]